MTALVLEGTVEVLLPELLLGNLDLIVGRLPGGRLAHGLGQKTLMEEGVSLVAGRNHPLARRKSLHWSDLTRYPWVLPPVNTLLREPLERAFEDHGLAMPADRIETLSVHVIRAYLHHTNAIAALAADVSRYYESLGLLAILKLELPKLVRPVGIMWNRQRPMTPGIEALIRCVEDASRMAGSPRLVASDPPVNAPRERTRPNQVTSAKVAQGKRADIPNPAA
jgi:DNA-binding transcriptional LysR family regulator